MYLLFSFLDFLKKVDFQLKQYFVDNYHKVTVSAPPYPPGIDQKYYDQMIEFFDNFEFDKSKYEVILSEELLDFAYKDIIQDQTVTW